MADRIERQKVYQLQPELPRALLGLTEAATRSLGNTLVDLVKIRCSQINHCAFCLNMHSLEARKNGENQLRLDVLAAWQEAACFDKRERAALALCDALTDLPQNRVSDELFASLQAELSEQEIVDLTAMIVVINGWNRIVAAMHFTPDIPTRSMQ